MSRIIIKDLPKNATEQELRNKFKETGNITDVKLVYHDGVFRGFAFMGFESPEQAQTAARHFNSTFLHSCKISVEVAKDLNDKSRPKAWKVQKDEWKQADQRREAEKKLRIQLSHLRRCQGDADQRDALLLKYKDDPKFRQYLELSGASAGLLAQDTPPTNTTDTPQSDEDEGIEEDHHKLANKDDVSDVNYWQSLMKSTNEKKASEQETEASPSKKKKQWKELHTVRLRIDNFPKKNKTTKDKKKSKKGLTKQDVKEFFNPLKCLSFRMNNKNRFEFFVGFTSEAVAKHALKKDGSYLRGVRVKVSSLGGTAEPAAVTHGRGAAPWAEAAARLEKTEPVAESGKLFVRNLSYLITEEKLKEKFAEHGELSEVELPVCKQTRKLKGFATLTFLYPHCAVAAMNALDGTELLGRVLHVLPALSDQQVEQQSQWMSSFKKQQEQTQKETAASWHNWNTLFLSSAAVVDIMAQKFKKTKEQILSTEGTQSVAVTLALGETQIVNETRRFLEEQGVSVEAFSDPSVSRSDTVLLVKNLAAGTKATDIAELFGKWGELGRVVMPPSGTTCVVEFLDATEARKALRNMHYKKFGHAPLYLEKAPMKTFTAEFKKVPKETPEEKEPQEEESENVEENTDNQQEIGSKKKRKRTEEVNDENNEENEKDSSAKPEPEAHTTVYVQNLPLEATEEDLMKHFSTAGEVHSIILAMKGQQSRGYGFVQYSKQRDARTALTTLENSTLGGRNLALKLSEKRLCATPKTARQMHDYGKQTSSKIAVKNIPFQATKTELSQLFRPFGAMKRVFLQKHHTGQYNNGGYGFVDFIDVEDAKRAIDTMGLSTHFLGRRLVLQWAKDDETVEELRQKTATKHDIVGTLGMGNKKMRHAMKEADDTRKGGGD